MVFSATGILPIPQVRKRSEENPLQIVLTPTDRLPVRDITVKLHKNRIPCLDEECHC